MMLIATRDGQRFEQTLRAEVLEPATNTLRFEFAGVPMVARRIDPDTIAVATEIGMLNRLLRANPRDGAWHTGVPEAGLAALESAPLAIVGERLNDWAAGVNLGFGIFDEPLARPVVAVFAPGPLGLRIDSYMPDDHATAAIPQPRAVPLRTLRRSGAFIAGQLHAAHPSMQRVMQEFVQRDDNPASTLMVELVRAAMPIERIGWTTRLPEAGELPGVTGLDLLSGTTIHWTSASPEADVARTRGTIETAVTATPAAQRNTPRFEYNPEGLAAADRTLGSWTLLLPNGRLAGMNLNALRQGLLALFPPRNEPMTLRGDVSWRDGLGSATFLRPPTEAIVDHRACPPDESFDADAVLNQVRAFLPGNRIAEMYLDTRTVLEGVMPLLEEMDMGYALPTVVPPIGMALGVAEGHIHGGVFVPAIALRPVGGFLMSWLEQQAVGQELGTGQPMP
jgi:hypothetical protein